MKLRLKTLEDGLKHVSSYSVNSSAFCGSPKTEKSSNFLSFLTSNGGLRRRSTSQPRGSTFGKTFPLQQPNVENETVVGELRRANSLRKKYSSGESMLKRSLWATKSKVVDSGEKENKEVNENTNTNENDDTKVSAGLKTRITDNEESQNRVTTNSDNEDTVSGFLYDRLQKEVINLRKLFEVKENDLNAKDQEIKVRLKILSISLSQPPYEFMNHDIKCFADAYEEG